MNEMRCKRLIKEDMQAAAVSCNELINEIDGMDLNDVDWQLDRMIRFLANAKARLKGCEDY
jgi:hypothetical protein